MLEGQQPMGGVGDPRRYAASLPRMGSRRLAEHERSSIRRRLRRLEVEAIAWIAILVAVTSIAASITAKLEPELVTYLGGTIGVVLAATGALGLVTCLFAARRAWRLAGALGILGLLATSALEPSALPHMFGIVTWFVVFALVVLGNGHLCVAGWQHARVLARRRRLQIDLEEGWVEQFAGQVTNLADETLRHLAHRGDLRLGGIEPHRLELLPCSGLVLRVDGRPLRRLVAAYMAEIAPTQPHAFRARLPAGLVTNGGGSHPEIDLRRRSLTPAERAEITTHIRRLRRGFVPVVAVTIAVLCVTGFQVWQGARWDSLLEGVSLAWYALAAIAWGGYVRRILAARRLEHDRNLRWVVTVHDAAITPSDPVPPRLEVLPISQLAWTENAAPALWRVSRI